MNEKERKKTNNEREREKKPETRLPQVPVRQRVVDQLPQPPVGRTDGGEGQGIEEAHDLVQGAVVEGGERRRGCCC